MSGVRGEVYRFADRDHWATCLRSGIAIDAEGGVAPRLGYPQRAERLLPHRPLALVAADDDRPIWRAASGAAQAGEALFGLPDEDFGGAPGSAIAIGGIAAKTPRLVVTRSWVWAFDATALARHDRHTLQLDRIIRPHGVADRSSGEADAAPTILDIAGDGGDGIWFLARAEDGTRYVRHIDCRGCPDIAWPLACPIGPVAQIAHIGAGATPTLVLLAEGGRQLWLVAASSGRLLRSLPLAGIDPCWRAVRLAGNGRSLFGLGGKRGDAAGSPWLFVLLDGDGEPVAAPFAALFSESDVEAGAHADTDAGASPPIVVADDVAIGRRSVWFATSRGLWRLAAAERATTAGTRAAGAGASGTLVTPALHSPITAAGRGWSRAEIDVELAEGTSLTISVAATDDPATAARVGAVAADTSLTAGTRQRLIWAMLAEAGGEGGRFVITGGAAVADAAAVPLFTVGDRWLWLRLEVAAPPGTPPPVIRQLRILYPERTLMAQLPALFGEPRNDPDGLFRRLVGVIETSTDGIDARIAAIGGHLDPATAPEDWLDFLAGWLALPWHQALPVARKRAIVVAAADLLDGRGTRAGLARLLSCLLGDGGSATIEDLGVDFPPLRLGGGGCAGSALPGLLAGVGRETATLGGKAVLGRARLPCPGDRPDPLATLTPRVRITLVADQSTRRAIEPLLAEILVQVIPAGVALRVIWVAPTETSTIPVDGLVLEGRTLGAIGRISRLGTMLLAGRPAPIGEVGLALDLKLS